MITDESPSHETIRFPPNTVNWTMTYKRDSDIFVPYGIFAKNGNHYSSRSQPFRLGKGSGLHLEHEISELHNFLDGQSLQDRKRTREADPKGQGQRPTGIPNEILYFPLHILDRHLWRMLQRIPDSRVPKSLQRLGILCRCGVTVSVILFPFFYLIF